MALKERLLEKSKEAFVLAIEIYNKPSIKYRLEGFSFFICNAWELMLKAKLIADAGEAAVYYPDKPNRTISLENCIQKIFTNATSPMRRNLEKVIELRNTSVHFVTEEYEAVYVPVLQACVFNFVDKMRDFHGIDMADVIPENFITLSVRLRSLDETEIRAKYSKQVAERLISVQQEIGPLIDANNSSFAIRLEHFHYQTKDKSKATEFYHITKEAKQGVRIISELKNPNDTHKYTAKACIREINRRLARNGIVLLYNGEPKIFNMYHFGLLVDYFGLKQDAKFCFVYEVQSHPQYSYSQRVIDFLFDEIKKAPDRIIADIKAIKAKK